MRGDVAEELLQLKLKRQKAYKNLRGLGHALECLGIDLYAKFSLPSCSIRPMKANEVRYLDNEGRYWIIDDAGSAKPELPVVPLSKVPLLLATMDQGSIGSAAMQFMAKSMTCMMIPDPYHRIWNDLKGAMRQALGCPWRVMLEMSVIFDLAYGPFLSSAFQSKRQDLSVQVLQTEAWHGETFQRYKGLICKERGCLEPVDEEGLAMLWASLGDEPWLHQKGPKSKLSRWWSWFQCAQFFV